MAAGRTRVNLQPNQNTEERPRRDVAVADLRRGEGQNQDRSRSPQRGRPQDDPLWEGHDPFPPRNGPDNPWPPRDKGKGKREKGKAKGDRGRDKGKGRGGAKGQGHAKGKGNKPDKGKGKGRGKERDRKGKGRGDNQQR